MPRDITKLLEYEAQRRPAVAHLLADLDTLSEDELAKASVPLPWMRQALLQIKRRRRHAMIMTQQVPGVVDGQYVDPMGEMYRWEGGARFITIGRTQIEMQTGQLVWHDGVGLWIDTIYTRIIDPVLRQNIVSCGCVTRTAYIEAVKERNRRLMPEADTTASATPQPVRFYRPG